MRKDRRDDLIRELKIDLGVIFHCIVSAFIFYVMMIVFILIFRLVISDAGGVLLFSTLLSCFCMLYGKNILACIEDISIYYSKRK